MDKYYILEDTMKKNVYFIPRNTWFYSTFARFPAFMRYFMTLGILCLIVLVWLLTSYRILSNMKSTYLAQIETALQQKNVLEEVQKNVCQLHSALKAKKQDIDLLATCAGRPDLYLQELLRMLQENNLTLQAYTPQPSKQKKWYTKHTLRLDCSGSYENILSYMQHVATSSELPLVYSYLHLEKQQDGILASCHISWYDFSNAGKL